MTALNTVIFVQGPIDPMELYHIALQQILFYDGRDAAPGDISFHMNADDEGREAVYAGPHEELPALLGVYHRPGGVMFTQEEAEERFKNGCGETGCLQHRPEPAHVILALATNILWENTDRNWNAGNLHSGLVWNIGAFLDGKKLPWKWQENITVSVHEGYDDLNDLVGNVHKVRLGISSPFRLSQMVSRDILRKMGWPIEGE